MFLKKDNLKLGLVIGLLMPLLSLVVLYALKFPSVTFAEFFEFFIQNNSLITSLGSLSLLANVAIFTVYINTHKDNTAKGIFAVTLLYGITILLIKLFN